MPRHLPCVATFVVMAVLCALSPKVNAATFSTIYVFGTFGQNGDASYPQAGVTEVNNLLWGTTSAGGASGHGAVYAINPVSKNEVHLDSFSGGRNGQQPEASLTLWHKHLYGTTALGGKSVQGLSCSNSGCGTIFEINPLTGSKKTIYSFASQNAQDGISPEAELLAYNDLLYGTTVSGGPNGGGTIFSFNPKTNVETPLFSFSGGPEPFSPSGGLVFIGGYFYGLTSTGGTSSGAIFKFDPVLDMETTTYKFKGQTNGSDPVGTLLAYNNILYGVTAEGGQFGNGVIFSIDPNSLIFRVMHSFKGAPDGANPSAGLILVNNLLYGTTGSGGLISQAPPASGGGTLYEFDPSTNAETVLYSFNSENEGWGPACLLSFYNGSFYGTTINYTALTGGSLFKFTP